MNFAKAIAFEKGGKKDDKKEGVETESKRFNFYPPIWLIFSKLQLVQFFILF